MQVNRYMMGLFTDDDLAARTIRALEETAWKVHEVYGPIPSNKIMDALKQKKSRVGWFTLAGGVTGFFAGFLLALFTATQWSLIVSGKPVVAWVPFFIVGFEFTILFGVIGNVIGLLTQARLPRYKNLVHHEPLCSGMHFGVVARCPEDEQERLAAFFRERGGEARRYYVY